MKTWTKQNYPPKKKKEPAKEDFVTVVTEAFQMTRLEVPSCWETPDDAAELAVEGQSVPRSS